MPRFAQSLEAFSSPVGVLDPETVNRDQREKLTVRQLGGVAGISSHGRMMSRIALELLRSGKGGLVERDSTHSSVRVPGLYEK